jgi:hypothetical protein
MIMTVLAGIVIAVAAAAGVAIRQKAEKGLVRIPVSSAGRRKTAV